MNYTKIVGRLVSYSFVGLFIIVLFMTFISIPFYDNEDSGRNSIPYTEAEYPSYRSISGAGYIVLNQDTGIVEPRSLVVGSSQSRIITDKKIVKYKDQNQELTIHQSGDRMHINSSNGTAYIRSQDNSMNVTTKDGSDPSVATKEIYSRHYNPFTFLNLDLLPFEEKLASKIGRSEYDPVSAYEYSGLDHVKYEATEPDVNSSITISETGVIKNFRYKTDKTHIEYNYIKYKGTPPLFEPQWSLDDS